jgi:hypothetical protein
MLHARIDISEDLEGEPVVLACFALADAELAASAHAIAATARERFRTASLSVEDTLELRELTALAEELHDLALRPGISTVVLRPARLTAYRHAIAHFLHTRDHADWLRDDDREALARVRDLLAPLQELSADAIHAALSRQTPRPT